MYWIQRGFQEWPQRASLPGASTGDPTHDKVMRRGLMGKVSQASGSPCVFLSIYPKTKICLFAVCYTIVF